ncbi:RNA polymerase sigma-E factor [Rhodopirellula europaea SH398]|uniref:RNA polymerase sigma-E factor n=1 Tax=Rhodopirellula europaea SH398 TaxID=1263868 RepID=M5S3Q5_9BACT|nr:RNA polymerase sigma-E factor [Rhodopirellula europaea SH398]
METEAERLHDIQSALSECLNSLPENRRQMIQNRYFESQTIDQIANTMSQGSSNVRVTLMRVRRQLAECIERRLATGGAS